MSVERGILGKQSIGNVCMTEQRGSSIMNGGHSKVAEVRGSAEIVV